MYFTALMLSELGVMSGVGYNAYGIESGRMGMVGQIVYGTK